MHGPDGWRQFILSGRQQGGDIETGIEMLIGNGNLVAERSWIRGSADGGAAVRGHGMTMHRIENGKLQEDWAGFYPET